MRYPGLRIVLLSAPSHPRRGSGYLQISSPFTVAGQPRNHPLSGSPRSLTDPTWDYRPLCFLLTFLRQGCQEIFKAGAVLAVTAATGGSWPEGPVHDGDGLVQIAEVNGRDWPPITRPCGKLSVACSARSPTPRSPVPPAEKW